MSETQQQQEEQKGPPPSRRNSRGVLGKGTRGDRVKSAWRIAMSLAGSPKNMVSLRQWAKTMLKGGRKGPEWEVAVAKEDLEGWLDVKTHVRTTSVKKAMKEAKSIKRSKPKKPSKERRRVKGNSGKR